MHKGMNIITNKGLGVLTNKFHEFWWIYIFYRVYSERPSRWTNSQFEAMADKTLCEFSAPTMANIYTRPTTNVGDNGFELKPALINMVQASQFCGKAHEDASAHLQHFLEICSTFTIKGVSRDTILLRLFPFSLLGKAKEWFYANKYRNTTWDNCSTAFLSKFFPIGKDQCSAWKNFKLPTATWWIYPWGMGTLSRLHIRMSLSLDGE